MTGPLVLIDTSAWVEYLRDTGSPACQRVDELLAGRFAVCDPVRMEVLAGARTESHLVSLRALLARGEVLPTGPAEFELAAALYRTCRAQGRTVRKLIDCLIGATAISGGAAVLHSDGDFDALTACTLMRAA